MSSALISSEIVASRVELDRHGSSVGASATEGNTLGVAIMVRLYGVDADLTERALYERVESVLRQNLNTIVSARSSGAERLK
jgi:hypothetical protein